MTAGMAQPSAWEACRFLSFSFWVFHRTDPHIEVLSLAFAFLIHNKHNLGMANVQITHSPITNCSFINLVYVFRYYGSSHHIVYASRDSVSGHGASPSPPSSLTHVHRCIGSRNATRQTLPTSVKLTSLSMHGSRNGTTQCMGGV